MWFLFGGIGVALLLVVAYGWGLAKGAELTRAAQSRLHDGLRATLARTFEAHGRERQAWLAALQASQAWLMLKGATRSEQLTKRTARDDALDTAEGAHSATDEALEGLRAVWADPNEPSDQAKVRAEQRALDAAQRKAARDRQNRADDEERNRMMS